MILGSIQDLVNRVKEYKPQADFVRVLSAFDYAKKSYEGIYRLSGDSYISHVLAVTFHLLPLKPDEDVLIASLLHCSLRNGCKLEEVQKLFGDEVAFLVEKFDVLHRLVLSRKNTELEVLRKTVLTIAKDLRVVLIQIADVLHNMETLDFVKASQRKEIATDALEIYAPIASRLGVYHLKTRIEDLAFKYLYPDQYRDLNQQLTEYVKKREKNIDIMKLEVAKFIYENKIEAQVEGRLKNLFSIYKKMKRKSRSTLADIHDIFAFRIIVQAKFDKQNNEVTDHLYTLLGMIHGKWTPILTRFKDYIAAPKPNGYKSLHTTVLGFSGTDLQQPVEIQIRSSNMHDQAEYGVASHWLYEHTKGNSTAFDLQKFEDRSTQDDQQKSKFSRYKDWFKSLAGLKIEQDAGLKSAKNTDIFHDRIYVFTPNGEVKDLPKAATPVDFAYAIHTTIGNTCSGAKVNGSIVPLNYELNNGDIVEILTRAKSTPRSHWISFVKSTHAKAKIKAYLNGQDKAAELSLHDSADHVKVNFNASTTPVVKKKKRVLKKVVPPVLFDTVFIAGEKDLPYKLALCCKPKPGEQITAFISRGNAVRIHGKNCKLLRNVDKQRLMEASWGNRQHGALNKKVHLMIVASDRVGLIRDLADVVAGFGVSIADLSTKDDVGNAVCQEIVLADVSAETLEKIKESLLKVKDVFEVR